MRNRFASNFAPSVTSTTFPKFNQSKQVWDINRNKEKPTKRYQKLEETKEEMSISDDESSISSNMISSSDLIFGCYESDSGVRSTVIYDFSENRNESTSLNSSSSSNTKDSKLSNSELYFDAYDGAEFIQINDPTAIKTPVFIVDPDYFSSSLSGASKHHFECISIMK